MIASRVSGAAFLAAAGLLTYAAPSPAQISLQAARTELLYSQNADPDCSKLHAIMDDGMLPFYVARLKVMNVPSGLPVAYRWSVPKNFQGLLASDLDLGPGAEDPAVAGMCAEFGNGCVLTRDKLKFYNQPSIFFLGPTCDVLPNNTEKQFHGGTTRITVKVTSGRRKVGRSSLTLGWGRNGVVTIFAEDTQGNFEDGIGKPNGVNISAITALGASLTTPPNPAPPSGLRTFFFDGSGFNSAESDDCPPFPQFNACVELDVHGVGRAFPTVEARYNDGSALCDKIEVRTGPCNPKAKLEVIAKPKLGAYDPDNPARSTVDLTVRLRNVSEPLNGLPACPFDLRGAGVLTCSEQILVGGINESKTTDFDLKHCSVTTSQGCLSDADCRCDTCQAGEICLTTSHCSQHFNHACNTDRDCEHTGTTPPCPECNENETCIHVLEAAAGPDIRIPPGGFFDLLHETVQMHNELPDVAKITDTWTSRVFIPDLSAAASLKYRIKGRPKPTPAP